MGRSLRRLKRRQPKIIKRRAKKPFTKSKAPEVTANQNELKRKLGAEATWDEMQKIDRNYEQAGLVLDATARFGRNTAGQDRIQQKAEEQAQAQSDQAGTAELDDDLNAAMGKVRRAGKAEPPRLTPHQRQIVQQLLEAHGDDVAAMMMDRRLNPMQHSRGVLQNLIAAFKHWQPGSGVDFRVPTKRLW